MTSTGGSARLDRRRFIAIAAAAGGSLLLPGLSRAGGLETITWRGVVLGAEASLTLQHSDAAEAHGAIEACLVEAARLERIFSLFDPESSIARLNATGVLEDAPADFRVLLSDALDLAQRSDGAFDPTIQPLWALYARHFNQQGAARSGPARADIEAALSLVGWRNVFMEGGRVRLLKSGMAVTLNGIAQGYITDKVGDLLRARGFSRVLVNMGEQLALGPKGGGEAWTIGISDPRSPDRVIEKLPVMGGAVATSGGYGCRFDPDGRFTHMLDPATGAPAREWASMTVVAERAAIADGLSTALSIVPDPARLLRDGARAYGVPKGESVGFWL
ncbi:FAD:protein FMN transferase [Hyphomicrobium zavarzinii]|uniref:FAD:protein FMN transferase n=1 Tax=Hyphomicrobium zavarzinii TaxID=48292 RepID=UPI00036078E3|nr:FAD:protein FMN transferase [Hyphomicrobium zavarzinii]